MTKPPGSTRLDHSRPPLAVRFAESALYGIVGLSLIAVVSSITALTPTIAIFQAARREVDDANMSVFESSLSMLELSGYAYAVFVTAYSVVVGMRPHFHKRGRDVTRVTTLVVAGLGLAATVLMLFVNRYGYVELMGAHPEEAAVFELAEAETTVWPNIANPVATVLAAGLYVTIIILLATPTARRYFEPPRPDVPARSTPQGATGG